MTKVMRQPEPVKPDVVYGPGGLAGHKHYRDGKVYEIGIFRFECWCGAIWFETAFKHAGYPERVRRLNERFGRPPRPEGKIPDSGHFLRNELTAPRLPGQPIP